MTDKEKLCQLLDSWGVPFTEENDHEGNLDIRVGNGIFDVPKDDSKIVGYSGFFTLYTFRPDGTFKEMGAWE